MNIKSNGRSGAGRSAIRGDWIEDAAVYRSLNDGLARLSDTALTRVRLFVCECGDPDCGEALEAPIATYEAVRAQPGRYLVAPGHEPIDAGQVLESSRRFSIVEQTAPSSTTESGGSVSGDPGSPAPLLGTHNGNALRKPPRVLVVDDDPSVRTVLALNLQLAGLEVLAAEDGDQGLDQARFGEPDLVVTDVKMPRLDGFELAEALRRDERTRAIPIIFLSGQTEPAIAARARALGALDYLTKPFDPVWLATRVTELLAPQAATEAEPESEPI